jgi:hypothetical protein
MRKLAFLALALSTTGLWAQTDFFGGTIGTPTSATQVVVLQARLTPLEENPVVTTARIQGVGTVVIRIDRPTTGPKTATFLITIDAQSQDTGAIRLAHIHRGAAGVNGPVVIDFGLTTTNLNQGGNTHIESQFVVSDAATLATVDQVLANPSGFYFNVHTAANPGGAIRGQLVETDLEAQRRMEASQAITRQLMIRLAAKEGLITPDQRDALLAQ